MWEPCLGECVFVCVCVWSVYRSGEWGREGRTEGIEEREEEGS